MGSSGNLLRILDGSPPKLSAIITQGVFRSNSASVGGAARLNGNIRLDRVVFEDNTASGGGTVYTDGGITTIVNSVFQRNSAAVNSAAVWQVQGVADLSNTAMSLNLVNGARKNCLGSIVSLGGNIIDTALADDCTGFTQTSDQLGVSH